MILVYPNDQRIIFEPPKTSQSSPHLEKTGRLFDNPHNLKLIPPQKTTYISDDTTPAESATRYQNPHQTLISTGYYPEQLESHDGMILQPGQQATWTAPPGTTSQKIYATGFDNHFISIQSGAEKRDIQILKNPSRINPTLYQHLWRYLFPNSKYTQWTFIHHHSPAPQTTLTCLSTQHPCLISEPHFFKETNRANKHQILILVDTLRHDAVSPEKTPYIHNFFKTAIQYSHSLASSNMTSPSVNSLLSCQRPEKIKDIAFAYGSPQSIQNDFYNSNKPSFPWVIKQNKIRTAMIGNISIISDTMGMGAHHGFDDLITIERDGYDTPRIIRSSIEWLNNHKDESFFLYIHLHAPHGPYKAPFKDIAKTFSGTEDLGSSSHILKWLYRAELNFTDRYIQTLLNSLRESNLLDSTSITLTADHGDQHTHHHFTGNEAGHAIKGASFDHGSTLLNDEIRVPLLISHPPHEKKQKQEIFSHWVSNLALGPYILNQFKIQTPDYCDYKNLNKQNDIIYFSGFKQRGFLFNGRYKYIQTIEPDARRFSTPHNLQLSRENIYIPEMLFDIHSDPEEKNTIRNPQLLSQIREIHRDIFQEKSIYTLHIQKKETATIQITTDQKPVDYPDFLSLKPLQNKFLITCKNCGDFSIAFNSEPNLTITNNNQEIHVYKTSSKIHLDAKTPFELHPPSPRPRKPPQAWIIHHINTPNKSHKISAANLKIERMLRQWGYLNDSSS